MKTAKTEEKKDPRITPEDLKKIEAYKKKLSDYMQPSVTADIIAVRPAFGELRSDQWRENPKFSLEILFIKRGRWPHEDLWALPGGFVQGKKQETVEAGALRELEEETHLIPHEFIPVGVFSEWGRDMRTWVISNAFITFHKRDEGNDVKGGDDAKEARWLRLVVPKFKNGSFVLPFYDLAGTEVDAQDKVRALFTIRGKYREDGFGGYVVTSVEKNPLAFDHGHIVAAAFMRLLSLDLLKLVFFFLPEKFTLSNYINVYQYLTGNSIEQVNIPNFRRQLTEKKNPLLEVCEGEFEPEGCGHATAKLYRRRK